MCEQSTDEHQGDSSAESSPSYSDAQIQYSKEHRGSPHDIAQAWVGGVGAAMHRELTSHLPMEQEDLISGKTPPQWALLPPSKITMPTYGAASTAQTKEASGSSAVVPVGLEESPGGLT